MKHIHFEKARQAFQAAVNAADPYAAVQTHLPDFDTPPLVIAFGKAAVRMAAAAGDALGGLQDAVVVTNPENAQAVVGARVFAASHPVPDAVGLEASRQVAASLGRAAKGRPVLCLISGGGSALLPAPTPPITLQDKADVNAALLASGADIVTMNLVRQQLSDFKGGGLLRYAKGPVTSLILSDVIGDDIRAIASGPTAPPLGTRRDARDVLVRLGLWNTVPEAVRAHLQAPAPPQANSPAVDNIMIGSNAISLNAMAQALPDAVHHQTPLTGDVADAARWVAGLPKGAHVFGGETTVTLTGTGKGGRNQDMALRVALLAHKQGWDGPWLYLQAGSDGRDGPTDAAGGVVTETTLAQIRSKGVDPNAALQNNDAYTALNAGDALPSTRGPATNASVFGLLIRN